MVISSQGVGIFWCSIYCYASQAINFTGDLVLLIYFFQLFLQSLFICSSTTAASLLYVYMNFFDSPRYVVIGANVVWQMSHGVHGFVYISMNRAIRTEIVALIYRGNCSSSSVEKLNNWLVVFFYYLQGPQPGMS
ncbi:hypothetical protein ANCCAN_04033 [Ancylostoma caninum]|uniref:7TM GPCR serpentine receptor class x (Srx) domain-containing protein n=1 Tax=Ancylostoma caninum TaxID=29170 RepID=A0A368GZI3_ANCCA|nr:hypothetical protein ANCCAN_04033 [Ancylostoma caninum]